MNCGVGCCANDISPIDFTAPKVVVPIQVGQLPLSFVASPK
jgi:hypothetical protein